jgi:hypothetical protein
MFYSYCLIISEMSTIEWEDVIELAEQLMRERLFLSSEQQQLQQLNDKVLYAFFSLTWNDI